MNHDPYEEKPEDYTFEADQENEELETIDEFDEVDDDQLLADENMAAEDQPKEERPTHKTFKKKGISKAKYNLLFYGSIFITIFVIAVIVIDKVTGVNIVRAPFTGEWFSKEKKPVEEKGPKGIVEKKKDTEYDAASNWADFALNKFKEAEKLYEGKTLDDLSAEELENVAKIYHNFINRFYTAENLWTRALITELNEKGVESELLTNKEDKVYLKIVKLEEIIAEVKKNKLSYLFKSYEDKDKELRTLQKQFKDQYDSVRSKTIEEELDEIAKDVESLDSKRIEIIGALNDSCFNLGELKEDSPEIEAAKTKVIDAANEYYLHLWKTLYMYYKYVKFAKENNLELNPNIVNIKNKVETSSFPFVEKKLANLGIELDRNTEFAKDVREKTDTMKNEVGDYGVNDTEDDDDDEGDRSYADDDEDNG